MGRLALLLLGHAAAWSGAHSGSFIQVDVPPLCGCDCCSVIDRRPNEEVNGVAKACAPSSEHQDCPEQCRTAPGDSVLRAAGEVMDSARFCFFECKPAKGFRAAPVQSACVALGSEDRKVLSQAAERTGNAVDPAEFIVDPAELPASDTRRAPSPVPVAESVAFLQIRQDPVADTTAVAESTREQAATTRAVGSDLREGAIKNSEKIGAAVAEGPGAIVQLKAVQDANRRAEQAAQEASKEAGDAEEAVLAARKAALEGGVQAGKDAMEQVKAADLKSTADLAAFRDKLVNKVELKAIAAAAKAAEPYHLSMMRAQKTVGDYQAQAQADMGKAKSLQAEAMDLADRANAAADKTSAAALYDEAKAKAAEAQTYAENAKNSFATADQMNQDIPKYQGAAQAAAAKAAFDSMPAWQPAPLMPFPDYAKR